MEGETVWRCVPISSTGQLALSPLSIFYNICAAAAGGGGGGAAAAGGAPKKKEFITRKNRNFSLKLAYFT
jgi:hypothetical protein